LSSLNHLLEKHLSSPLIDEGGSSVFPGESNP